MSLVYIKHNSLTCVGSLTLFITSSFYSSGNEFKITLYANVISFIDILESFSCNISTIADFSKKPVTTS